MQVCLPSPVTHVAGVGSVLTTAARSSAPSTMLQVNNNAQYRTVITVNPSMPTSSSSGNLQAKSKPGHLDTLIVETPSSTTPPGPASVTPTTVPSTATASDTPTPSPAPHSNGNTPSQNGAASTHTTQDSPELGATERLAAAVAAIDLSPGGTDADVALAPAAAPTPTTPITPTPAPTPTDNGAPHPAADSTTTTVAASSPADTSTAAPPPPPATLDYKLAASILGLLVDSDLVDHAAAVLKHLMVERSGPEGSPATLDAHDVGMILGHCVAADQPESGAAILIALYNERAPTPTPPGEGGADTAGAMTAAEPRNGPPCQQLLPFALGALLDCGSKAWAETLATHLLFSDGASDDDVDVGILGWCMAKSVWVGRADWAAELLDLIKQQRHDWFDRKALVDAVVAFGGDRSYANAIEQAAKLMSGMPRGGRCSRCGGSRCRCCCAAAPAHALHSSICDADADANADAASASALSVGGRHGSSHSSGRDERQQPEHRLLQPRGPGRWAQSWGAARAPQQQQQQQRHSYASPEDMFRYQQEAVAAAAAAAQGYGYGYSHPQAHPGFSPYNSYPYAQPAMYNAAAAATMYAAANQGGYAAEAYGYGYGYPPSGPPASNRNAGGGYAYAYAASDDRGRGGGRGGGGGGFGGDRGVTHQGGVTVMHGFPPGAVYASPVGNPQMTIPAGVMFAAGSSGAGGGPPPYTPSAAGAGQMERGHSGPGSYENGGGGGGT
ncbi:MAG: hypothetical protein WDW38_002552 [Sanguina aurantia]